ncbi:MAG: hypothetical protein ACPGTG_05725 [Flavobacteriales bacterium]
MFDFQNKPYAIVVDIAAACLLSAAIYLLSNQGVIPEFHSFFYVIFTPIIALLLIRKRKQEQDSDK